MAHPQPLPQTLYAHNNNLNAWYIERLGSSTHKATVIGVEQIASCLHTKDKVKHVPNDGYKCECGELMEIASFKPRK